MRKTFHAICAASFVCTLSTTTFAQTAPDVSPTQADFSGIADYYSSDLHGKRTASGQVHDKTKLMAAHRSLRFGTRVKLVNRRTKKSCIVTINDRGPFTKNRIIDVSQEAARRLGLFTGSRLVDCYILNDRTKEIASK